jgi:hypothetical protein
MPCDRSPSTATCADWECRIDTKLDAENQPESPLPTIWPMMSGFSGVPHS